jgi:hypothetical protein
MAAGLGLVFGDRRLWMLMLLGWLVAFYAVSMDLATPYTASFRSVLPIAIGTGPMFAAGRLVLLWARRAPPHDADAVRQRPMGPMAVAACGVLLLCWLREKPPRRTADHRPVRGHTCTTSWRPTRHLSLPRRPSAAARPLA